MLIVVTLRIKNCKIKSSKKTTYKNDTTKEPRRWFSVVSFFSQFASLMATQVSTGGETNC
jgi:hypothetical protein